MKQTIGIFILQSPLPRNHFQQSEIGIQSGSNYGKYNQNETTFDISMCQAPLKECPSWVGSMLFFPCAQYSLRYKALNHIERGSGWDNYICCQGYMGGVCCINPGSMGEKSCPQMCMCLEACCCPGLAVSATSMLVRDRYSLGLDDDDVRLIRFNNCLQCFVAVANCAVCIFSLVSGDDSCRDNEAMDALNCFADTVFCCISSCMSAQVHHEIKVREGQTAPVKQIMERY